MQDMQKYVVELLFKHDCVIIPNLGGFVAQYKSAALDDVTGFFSPPSKQILFNINLKNNDGLLANEIAQHKQITYNEANELLLVGKFGQPIPMTNETDITFVIRYDQ